MTIYRDPNAPHGRVAFGGEAFVDGLTADIDPGPETLALFAAAGIVEEPTITPDIDREVTLEVFIPANPTKADLQAAAAELGLDTSGTKSDIQARLDEHRPVESADDTKE